MSSGSLSSSLSPSSTSLSSTSALPSLSSLTGGTGGFSSAFSSDQTPSWLTPWLTGAGSPFATQFGSAPLMTLNQLSQPTVSGTTSSGSPVMDFSQLVGNTQQAPWWSAFMQTPGTSPLSSLLSAPTNFSSMWGFSNPALLPLLLLEQSQPLSPLQVSVPPVAVPPPLPPVIQPGNPAPSPLGGFGGGGDSGGGDSGSNNAPAPPPQPTMTSYTSHSGGPISQGGRQLTSPTTGAPSDIYQMPDGNFIQWQETEPKGD